jgi:hypothetical protein
MKKLFYLILSLMLFEKCSYVLDDYQQGSSQRFLTIEAELTNLEGRSFVNIAYSSAKTVNDVLFSPIGKAKVYFIDNQGVKEFLSEVGYGFYKPSATFKGQVGKTYAVHIETPEGGVYESAAEKILVVPAIDSVYDEFEERSNYPVGNPGRYVYNTYLDFKDTPTPDEYYQWTATNYTEVAYCKKCNQSRWSSATQRCEKAFFRTQSYIYACNQKCFDLNPTSEVFLLSDKNVNGNLVRRQKLAVVPFGDLSRYYLLIEQRRLTENAFTYFNAVKQQRNNGTFFDVPALTQFSNNIKSVSNPAEKIIGVWNVFPTVQKQLIIERNKVVIKEYIPQTAISDGIYEIPPMVSFPCEESATRTKEAPLGWK